MVATARKSLFLALLLALATPLFAAPIQVGAIRWDAWYDDSDSVGRAVEASLAPARYHYRLPSFAQVLGPGQVRIDGNSQAIIDREIDLAAEAGLSYWAFCLYPQDKPISLALAHYLASPRRDRIKFSLITTPSHYVWPEMTARIESLIRERDYLTVENGRPVIFLGFISEAEMKSHYGGQPRNFRAAIDAFRGWCRERKIPAPYFVIMDFTPAAGKKWLDLLGADAITSYTTHGNMVPRVNQPTPFADLTRGVEWFWDQCRATGAPVVPIVVTGGDRRPRIEHPVPWEKYQKPGVGLDKYVARATPADIAAQTADALRWLRANSASAPAQLALIYAWNENDEGGWLIPTLGDGHARLEALRKVLVPPSP